MSLVRCEICGRTYDERGYQVLLPGAARGFDCVECALRAEASRRPTFRLEAVSGPGLEPFERMAAELFIERIERNEERRRLEDLEAENARLVGTIEELSARVADLKAPKRRWPRRLGRQFRSAA